jgi:ABC-type branched-subunit amino acid transport system ATPase component
VNLLEAKDILKVYGGLKALDGAGLAVAPNEFHGLIGPNGSGKSTMLKCLAGAEIPTEGRIFLGSRDITGLTPPERSRAGLSLKFQITAVLPELSVYDNLLLALQAHGSLFTLLLSLSRRALHERVMDSLARFKLAQRHQMLAAHLSHGEQQWLEIAMAMACEPKVLLLDEPTAGMSPQERRATGELLAPIKSHCSLLIVEHDLDFIKDICDSLTVLDQGHIVASGPTRQVQDDPRVRDAYLSHAH